MAYNFCVIEGIALRCLVDSSGEDQPELMGRERRLFNGSLRSTFRTPKLNFTIQVDFLTATEATQFLQTISKPAANLGTVPKPCVVSSDADGLTRGRTILARVQQAGRLEPKPLGPDVTTETTFWTAQFTIREI